MKLILPILVLTLVFLTGCGNQVEETQNIVENISEMNNEMDEFIVEPIECPEGEVAVDGKCELIDPYGVLKDDENVVEEVIEPTPIIEEIEENVAGVKTFDIVTKGYDFYIGESQNPDIIVNFGDKVIINYKSENGCHSWNSATFAARTKTLCTNESETVEFVADRAGEFEYYCSSNAGKHEKMGERGKLIVLE